MILYSSFMEEYLHLTSVYIYLWRLAIILYSSRKEIANYVSKLIMNKVRVDFPHENEKTCFDTLRSIKMLFNVVLCNKRNNLLKIMIITQNICIPVFLCILNTFYLW